MAHDGTHDHAHDGDDGHADDRHADDGHADDGHDPDDGERPPFRLLVEERALLCPDVDHEAVEQLVSMLPVDVRPYVFRYFLDWAREDPEEVLAAFPEIEAEGPPGRRTFLLPQPEQLAFHDPELQALLERALARRTLWGAPGDPTPDGA